MSVFSIDMQVLSDLKRCSISIDMQMRSEREAAKGRSFYRHADANGHEEGEWRGLRIAARDPLLRAA